MVLVSRRADLAHEDLETTCGHAGWRVAKLEICASAFRFCSAFFWACMRRNYVYIFPEPHQPGNHDVDVSTHAGDLILG